MARGATTSFGRLLLVNSRQNRSAPCLMDAHSFPALSVLPASSKMREKQVELANAVVATDISAATADPCIEDISRAILNQFNYGAEPLVITRFHPEFIIRFGKPDERNLVLSSEILYGSNFTMRLKPWTTQYRSNTIYWHTEIAVDITGLPPHYVLQNCLDPLLSRHCDIQAYRINERESTIRAIGYAHNVESIPTTGTVSFPFETFDGVGNDTFPVAMKTYLLSEAPEFLQEPNTGSPGSIGSIDTAIEYGVDRELLQEAYEEQHRANQELERPASSAAVTSSGYYNNFFYHTDASSGSDSHGWESDRSWKLY